ncbi:MAG: hypothetical protein RSF67_08445, partial [Clostridia bacterium]
MKIRIKQEKIQWQDLIGKEIINNNLKVVCSAFEEDKLYINEWINDNLTGHTSVISTLDTAKCISHLQIFGYELEFEEVFAYSSETIQKAQGLILAGFNKLIKIDNNYMVDNIFQQNILLED